MPTVRKVSSKDKDVKGRAQRILKRENKKIVEMLINKYDAESVSLDGKKSLKAFNYNKYISHLLLSTCK